MLCDVLDDRLPYEIRTFYEYLFGYVHQLLSVTDGAIQMATASVVYSGGCLYAIAYLEHLTGLFVAANVQFLL